MKKLLLTIIFTNALWLTHAQAENNSDDSSDDYFCTHASNDVEKIMYARQYTNLPITETNKAIDCKMSPILNTYYKLMARQAYEMPKFSSKKMKDEVISEFASKAYLDCLDTINKSE